MEQGKINLDNKINTYLPSYRGEGGSKVSIHQLLNHTSGMKNTDTATDANFMRYGIGFYHKPYTLEEIVNNFCSNPLVNEPGKKFDYNNGEYMILGRILEVIYKKPYEQILEEQILIPLGMNNSGIINHYKLIANLATPYYKGSNSKYKRMERYGRIQGANCVWFHYLNRNVSIIILSNTNLTDLGDFALKIGKEVF